MSIFTNPYRFNNTPLNPSATSPVIVISDTTLNPTATAPVIVVSDTALNPSATSPIIDITDTIIVTNPSATAPVIDITDPIIVTNPTATSPIIDITDPVIDITDPDPDPVTGPSPLVFSNFRIEDYSRDRITFEHDIPFDNATINGGLSNFTIGGKTISISSFITINSTTKAFILPSDFVYGDVITISYDGNGGIEDSLNRIIPSLVVTPVTNNILIGTVARQLGLPSETSACTSPSSSINIYTDKTRERPDIGDIIYTNLSKSSTYAGDGDWYAIDSAYNNSFDIRISINGVITDTWVCEILSNIVFSNFRILNSVRNQIRFTHTLNINLTSVIAELDNFTIGGKAIDASSIITINSTTKAFTFPSNFSYSDIIDVAYDGLGGWLDTSDLSIPPIPITSVTNNII